MEKPTDLIDALRWRYATKQFDSGNTLSDDQIDRILEACRLTPSSFGLQPWGFVVVTDEATRESLKPLSWDQPQVTDCSHLLVLCRKDRFGDEDIDRFITSTAEARSADPASLEGYKGMMKGFLAKMDEDALNEWMSRQVYLALGNLLTAAAVEGIDACPMEGFDPPAYDKVLDLPAMGLRSVVVCALGTRDTGDKYASLAKVRYPKGDVVFTAPAS